MPLNDESEYALALVQRAWEVWRKVREVPGQSQWVMSRDGFDALLKVKFEGYATPPVQLMPNGDHSLFGVPMRSHPIYGPQVLILQIEA